MIDERFNTGGQAADYIIQYMQRKIWNYWIAREGADYTTSVSGIYGPKAMIANEFAGSGGDRCRGISVTSASGQIVGKRTWGGLVGIGGYQSDRQRIRDRAALRILHHRRQWEVENHGVELILKSRWTGRLATRP